MGRHGHAIAAFSKALGRGPGTVAALGRAYALDGKRSQANKCLRELQQRSATEYESPSNTADPAALNPWILSFGSRKIPHPPRQMRTQPGDSCDIPSPSEWRASCFSRQRR